MSRKHIPFSFSQIKWAAKESFKRLMPQDLFYSPVLFLTYLSAVIVSIFLCFNFDFFNFQIALWLWFTVIFANFASALSEGRGKAQAESLKQSKVEAKAKKLEKGRENLVAATEVSKGEKVVCYAGDIIPIDGTIIEGIALVDESAITGESAPVIRESGGDRSAVTAGTRVVSDRIVIESTSDGGHTFLDKMIALIEGAERQKTPNETALTIVLSSLTLVFLYATATLKGFAHYAGGIYLPIPILIALFICLIPTTIGALLNAIGIAGMDRLIQRNVIAKSGRAIEAAGDVNLLVVDKTGTITLGNRMAIEFIPAPNVKELELAEAAQLASLSDETPEGRSIVVLAKQKYGLRGEEVKNSQVNVLPFSAEKRLSGIDLLNSNRLLRKGAVDAIKGWLIENEGDFPADFQKQIDSIAQKGETPLLVAENNRLLGLIALKDVVKGGIKERFNEMRKMGIKTIMITGDNPLTAASIAAEAGVDDFIAQAKPEDKLKLIREEQKKGYLIAMTGDGTNDAPALAQADVGVAMNTGTQPSREAGNMVDLDSDPTKLIDIIEIGKELLMTRGALTTFSIANDVAKYFAILPAIFADIYGQSVDNSYLNVLNVMNLSSREGAILSAVIFNALVILALIPIALKGVKYRPASASQLLFKNLIFFGLGGIIAPFIGIKLIDLLINSLGWI